MMRMLSYDQAKYPAPGSKQKIPSSLTKDFSEMTEEELLPARKAVLEQLEKESSSLLESLLAQSGGQVYEACSDSYFFSPSQRGYVQAGVSTGGLQVFFLFFLSFFAFCYFCYYFCYFFVLLSSFPPFLFLPLAHLLSLFFSRWKALSLNLMSSETKSPNTPTVLKRSKRKWAFTLRGLLLVTRK